MAARPPQPIRRLLIAVALVLVVSACSDATSASHDTGTTEQQSITPTTTPPAPSSSVTSTSVAEDPVLVAYAAFWDLYLDLGGTPPPFDPVAVTARLDELTTGAEHEQLFGFFRNNATTGLVLRGDSDHAPTIVSNDGQVAVVEDCVDDRVGVYRADGSRVDTDVPDRRTYRTVLRQIDGAWKVERVDMEATCTV